jgi:pyruvate dehydrogenase E1 component
MRRMLQEQEDVFYYVTVMNENYVHPPMPQAAEEGIRKGMYLLRRGEGGPRRVSLLGSGTILREVIAAGGVLEKDHGIAADVWSVTSFSELRRDALSCDGAPWIEKCLSGAANVVAATDYVRAVPEMVREWVPGRYATLGTDGFGRSDTRAALRAYFGVDRDAIVRAALGNVP